MAARGVVGAHLKGGGTARVPQANSNKQTGEPGNGGGKQSDRDSPIRAIIDSLTSIKEGLKKGEVSIVSSTLAIEEVIARVSQYRRMQIDGKEGVEGRLDRIEQLLLKGTGLPTHAERALGPQTWANVASSPRQAGGQQGLLPTRHTIRVQAPAVTGLENAEILREIKKTVSNAIAVRVLQSGDIDVTMPDELSKDRAQNLPPTDGFKIYKKDYFVEVPGVPLRIVVAPEKYATNEVLARQIAEESKAIAPGLQITRIQWLHSQKDSTRRMREVSESHPKTRGSLLVAFRTQEMRRTAIQKGLVIGAEIFEVRQFERGLFIRQCFRCSQWGHSQFACKKQAKCGVCAGAHETRTCKKGNHEGSCGNCGGDHPSFYRIKCRAFKAYFQTIQEQRANMYAQSYSMRIATDPRRTPSPTQVAEWTEVSRKRTRAHTPEERDIQRRVGRPTYVEQASRDPRQQRLGFNGLPAGEAHAISSQDVPESTLNQTQTDMEVDQPTQNNE
jgi:hypothetical protein